MLKMYGGDTRPFLDNAWNAIIGEIRVRPESSKETANQKRIEAGTPAARRGAAFFFGELIMFTLNVIACVMLLAACLSRLPFPYYDRLRWICFAAFTYTAVWRMKDRAAVICLPLACLFNPFFSFHFSRNVWSFIDVLSLLLLLVMSFSFLGNSEK